MSKKERQCKVILEQLESGMLKRLDAAKCLNVSKRHLIRLIKRYQEAGDAGLVHRSRGRRSGRAYSAEFKSQVLNRYEERYDGFGPTLAAEKLSEEDELIIHRETLRLWLKASGLWRTHRKLKGVLKETMQFIKIVLSKSSSLKASQPSQKLMRF